MAFSFTHSRGGLLLALALAGPGAALAQSGAPSAQALAYFAAQSQRQGLHDGDATNPSVTSSYFDQSSGLTHTYLRQRVNGLDIYGAVGDVHTDRTGKPVLMHQSFCDRCRPLAPSATPGLTAEQAVGAAAAGLRLPRPVGLTLVKEARPADGLLFNNGGISEYDIPVRLLYLPVNGRLVLVWEVTIAQLDQQHHWSRPRRCPHRPAARQERLCGRRRSDLPAADGPRPRSPGQGCGRNSARSPLGCQRHPRRPQQHDGVARASWKPPRLAPAPAVPFTSINPAVFALRLAGERPARPRQHLPCPATAASATGYYLTRGNNVMAYDDSPTTTSGNGNLFSNTNSPDGRPASTSIFPLTRPRGPKPARRPRLRTCSTGTTCSTM